MHYFDSKNVVSSLICRTMTVANGLLLFSQLLKEEEYWKKKFALLLSVERSLYLMEEQQQLKMQCCCSSLKSTVKLKREKIIEKLSLFSSSNRFSSIQSARDLRKNGLILDN